MYSFIQRWFSSPKHGSSSLDRMRLGPDNTDLNPLMVWVGSQVPTSLANSSSQIQFFTWDTLQDNISWWKHFENEVPHLVQLGFTQVWLPPMNKAAQKVSSFIY